MPRARPTPTATVRVAVLGYIGAVDDPGHQGKRGVGAEAVFLDEDLERAETVAVGVGRARGIEAGRAYTLRVRQHLVKIGRAHV